MRETHRFLRRLFLRQNRNRNHLLRYLLLDLRYLRCLCRLLVVLVVVVVVVVLVLVVMVWHL